MAVRVPTNTLTQEQSLLIREHLFMQPKEKYKAYGKQFNYNTGPKKEPIQFYLCTNDYIDLPMAFAAALTKKVPNRDRNHLKVNLNFDSNKSLRDNQKEVAKEALSQITEYGGTHLGLYPGFGKTILSAWLSCKLGYLTIVFINRTGLITQWCKAFGNFTNAKYWIVGEKFPDVSDGYISVIICMNERLHYVPKELLDVVGTVIVDESHNFCTPSNVSVLLGTQPRYFISCSATLKQRTDEMHKMIEAIVGNNSIYLKSTIPFEYVEVKTNIKIPLCNNKMGTTDFTKFTQDISSVQRRNALILQLVTNLKDKKILVMTHRVDHAEYLEQCLKMYGEDVDRLSGKKDLYSDSRVLVGTYSKIGEGFDEENRCEDYGGTRLNTLILCTSFRSEIMIEQICGRVFRSQFPTIYDLVDNTRISKNHWRIRRKWYDQRNGKHLLMNIQWDYSSLPCMQNQ